MKNLISISQLTKYEEEIEKYIHAKTQAGFFNIKRISPFTLYQIVNHPSIDITYYIYSKLDDVMKKYIHKQTLNVDRYSEKENALKTLNSIKINSNNLMITEVMEYPAAYNTIIPFALSELANNTLTGYHAVFISDYNHGITFFSKENIDEDLNKNIRYPDKEYYSAEQVNSYDKWFKS
jgi:hypothetical protein